jgi:hypothetical protein
LAHQDTQLGFTLIDVFLALLQIAAVESLRSQVLSSRIRRELHKKRVERIQSGFKFACAQQVADADEKAPDGAVRPDLVLRRLEISESTDRPETAHLKKQEVRCIRRIAAWSKTNERAEAVCRVACGVRDSLAHP